MNVTKSHCYGLIITFLSVYVMHQSFVTTASSPGKGGGLSCECAVFLFLHGLRRAGEIPGICVRQNWQCNVKHNRLLKKTAVVLPSGCPRTIGFVAGICCRESQNPRYSPELGCK